VDRSSDVSNNHFACSLIVISTIVNLALFYKDKICDSEKDNLKKENISLRLKNNSLSEENTRLRLENKDLTDEIENEITYSDKLELEKEVLQSENGSLLDLVERMSERQQVKATWIHASPVSNVPNVGYCTNRR
jgi:hypothetical protein